MSRFWLLFAVLPVLSHGIPFNFLALDPSIQMFREYLQIDTTTAQADLQNAVDFWKKNAALLDFPVTVHEYIEGYPIVVIEVTGTDPSLKTIMLNSHMDTVTYTENEWRYHPLSAHLDENDVIWARGTQDMKSVSIQYFEALRRLKYKNRSLLRTVYITLMPDEEMGGEDGIIPFLKSEDFGKLNVGIALDEGTSYPIPFYAMFYKDKVVWQIQIDCYGSTAHGSTFTERNDTATGQCINFMDLIYEYRDEQYVIAQTATIFDASNYTSINMNRMNAGIANNIVPDQVTLMFDIRIAANLNLTEFEETLNSWVKLSGDNVTLTYILKNPQSPATLANTTNPYYAAIAQAATNLNITVVPLIPPGSTDARHVRNFGTPAFGFSPMANTPTLLHMADERINATTFLEGINIYEEIITKLANIPANETIADPTSYTIGNMNKDAYY